MRKKEVNRKKRHYTIRKRIQGTAQRPRLVVKRSLNNLHVQVIDDINEQTLYAISTNSKDLKNKNIYGGNISAAKELAKVCASGMKEKNINTISFDRAGRLYHGRIKAFADTLRESGIKF